MQGATGRRKWPGARNMSHSIAGSNFAINNLDFPVPRRHHGAIQGDTRMTQQRPEPAKDGEVAGEPCQPRFDPEAFAAMVAKGRKAWADVPNATEWVEKLRGVD